ncbi:MAG: glycosyltransferase family 1 protein [Candidatus Gottesmanbacteria bacterium]|nr:glycosyltransferase family 1 protein [Candidatus Gottesmanbacteria bacterium]
MKIAIDITPLESAHKARGVGVYTKNLIDALEKYENRHTYLYFTGKQFVPADADIVHFPYFDPFFLTLPLVKRKPTVVTVHDLIPMVFPYKFPAGVRGAIKWQVQKLSLRRASRIIADSLSSKNDIARVAGVKKEIIDTVYLAPDPAYRPVTNQSILDGIRRKYSLSKQYVLFVGDVNWNKNVIGLLHAFAALRKHKELLQFKLVLVGGAFGDNTLPETQEINQFILEHDLKHVVIFPGNVPLEDLSGVYSSAAVYVQPSYYEGFGLPVLEAMACGCPVVSTNTSSLKEIAGPAMQVSPKPEAILMGITKMLTVDRRAQAMRQFEWVKQFTWKRVASETIASYERILM